MRIEIAGHVVSKKNLLRFDGRSGRTFHDKDVEAEIKALDIRAWIAWKQANGGILPAPLVHPSLAFTFHVANASSDRDNKLTTMLDCLQEAQMLKNDNVRHFNGRIIIEPAVLTKGEEKTVIEVLG